MLLTKKQKIKEQLNLWIPLFLSIPLMITEMIMMISNFHVNTIAYDWIAFVFATIVIFYFGREFYKWAFLEIFKYKMIGMNVLVCISSFFAYGYSTYLLIYKTIHFSNTKELLHIMSFYEVSATIISIVNAGEYIAGKIREKSNQDILKLSNLMVPSALLYDIEKNTYEEIETNKLKIGDKVFVKKGTKIPIDGIIYDKPTEVDEALLTGESKSIYKNIGDSIIGGSINLSNDFIFIVTKLQNDTILNSIIENVKKIENSKNKTQRTIDILAKFFTPIVILSAVIAFLLQVFVPNIDSISKNIGFLGNVDLEWINGGNDKSVRIQKGIYFFIATLSISCPCALGIAAPVANLIGIGKGARNGIIFNNSEVFQNINKINKIVFDKTGTLTTGDLHVVNFIGKKENLSTIYEMEKISFHPLSKAIIKYCKDNKISFKNNSKKEFNIEIPGVGITNKKDNTIICGLDYAIKNNFKINKSLDKKFLLYIDEISKNQTLQTIVIFAKNKTIENYIFLEDEIREDALKVLKELKRRKIEIAILSGDSEKNVKYIANKLNVNEYYYGISPNEKYEIIKRMQSDKIKVAYVGDGINDLEALKQADLSFSITNDNEAAKVVSDINLIYLNINNIYKAIAIAKQTRIGIITNLLWAFGYNIITIPLAVLGFIPALIGVYIMMFSDITVNLNSLIFRMIKVKDVA